MKRIITFLILVCCSLAMDAGDQQNPMEEAQQAFEEGQWDKAIASFSALEKEGANSPELYYNLGTCYLAKDDIGRARLYLERAALFAPDNPDINNNLNITKDKLKTTIIPLEPFFLNAWWSAIARLTTPKIWAIGSLILLASCLFFVFQLWFKKGGINNQRIAIVAISLGVIMVLLGLTRHNELYHHNTAIVLQPTQMLNSASKNSELIQNLSQGVKLNVVEKYNEWSKIQTMALEEGWVLSDDLAEL